LEFASVLFSFRLLTTAASNHSQTYLLALIK